MSYRQAFVFVFVLGTLKGFSQYKERDWEARNKWQNVPGILQAMDVKEGSVVADVGCHEGFLTIPLAEAVGTRGKVFAVDIESYKLKRLKEILEERNLQNVETVLGDTDDPKLPAGELDAVVILDAYHEMDKHQAVLAQINKALKHGGRLVIVDEMEKKYESSSRSQQMSTHNLAMKFALQDLERAGFKIKDKRDVFVKWGGKENVYLWLVTAEKKESTSD